MLSDILPTLPRYLLKHEGANTSQRIILREIWKEIVSHLAQILISLSTCVICFSGLSKTFPGCSYFYILSWDDHAATLGLLLLSPV